MSKMNTMKHVESKEPRREERKEAKMSPKARAAMEKKEGFKAGGKVKAGKKC